MSETSDLTFSGREAAEAHTALREALGLAPERFPVEAFIGMISDEIEQLRARGRTTPRSPSSSPMSPAN